MNREEIKIVKSDEAQQIQPVVDKSRRSFSKAGIVAPVIMTLANKTALGATPYHCTMSGQQSGNHSGNHDWTSPCGVGFSPGAWKTPLDTGDGSLAQWLNAGAVPYDILMLERRTIITCAKIDGQLSKRYRTITVQLKINNNWETVSVTRKKVSISECVPSENSESKKYYIDPSKTGSTGLEKYIQNDSVYDQIDTSNLGKTATLFSSIFGGNSNDSFMDILMDQGSIDRSAIAVWLNAGNKNLFTPVYDDISQSKVVELYQNNPAGLWDYFKLIYHPDD